MSKKPHGNTGRPMSEYNKARLREANVGLTRSPEHRKAISDAVKRKWATDPAYAERVAHAARNKSPEAIENIRAAASKPKSAETREKMSIATKAQWARRRLEREADNG